MRPIAASVRLMLVGLFLTSIYHLGHAATAQPNSQFLRAAQGNQVCKTFQLCHNSKGLAYTSVDVFSALEPLFERLQLTPVNDYVNVVELDDCVKEGCCCSTPVEVQLRLPLRAGGAADKLMQVVGKYLSEQLPKAIGNLVCVGELKDSQCAAGGAEERHTDMRRRLMEDDVSSPAVAEVPAVFALESAPEADAYGYGSYGSYGYGGYGYGAAAAAAPAAAEQPRVAHLVPADEAAAAEPVGRPTSRSLIESSRAAAAPVSRAVTCPPCPTCGGSSAGFLSIAPPAATGACYCRHDGAGAAWALQEAQCRNALFAKCGASGSLLECSALESFYTPGRAAADKLALADQISAFLYVDCPPNPPCSCAGLRLDGGEARGAKGQCCSDLRAHCSVPFSGLDCDEVDAFCSAGPGVRAPSAVRQFVAVKSHGQDCSSAQNARAYTRLVAAADAAASAGGAAAQELLQQLAGARAGAFGGVVLLLVGAAMGAGVAAVIVAAQAASSRRERREPLLSNY